MRPLPLILLLTCLSPQVSRAVSPVLAHATDDFTSVAERAGQWVVNISTAKIERQVMSDPFFSQMFDIPGGGVRRTSLGSGLILSEDGQILTNAHVVENADEITVKLLSGEEFKGTVMGQDENVDLAVIKIDAHRPLPAAVLGDSDQVRVGQWAIAIGNPLGFDHSVTVGVISAKSRDNVLGEDGGGRYQNFLQTDASINRGNSGGPLCNIRGEVIGLNAAIVTPNEGSIGIGFAIPINMAKRAVPDLLKRGRVVLPELGFYMQDLTPQLAQAKKLNVSKGVLVTDVAAGGAAAKAGLSRDDVILSAGGHAVNTASGLKNVLYEFKPGETITMVLLRKGKNYTVNLVGEDPRNTTAAFWHGLQVVENSRGRAAEMGLAVASGVVITRVAKKSSAAETGLMPKDVVLEVDGKPIKKLEDWKKVTEKLSENREVMLRVVRDRSVVYVVLRAE